MVTDLIVHLAVAVCIRYYNLKKVPLVVGRILKWESGVPRNFVESNNRLARVVKNNKIWLWIYRVQNNHSVIIIHLQALSHDYRSYSPWIKF